MKLALGTAQFGLDYGISNKSGKTNVTEIERILSYCKKNNVGLIDTAYAYGDSEHRLGMFEHLSDFDIVTKLPLEVVKSGSVHEYFNESLRRLGVNHVSTYMLHNSAILSSSKGDKIYNEMLRLKNEGFIDKVGCSVYTSQELDSLIERYDFDVFQVPFSPFDQEILNSKYINNRKQIEIHVRSIFLQGLYFISIDDIHPYFEPVKDKILKYREILNCNNFSVQEFIYGFLKSYDSILSYILLAVENEEQLKENIDFYRSSKPLDIDYSVFDFGDNAFRKANSWKL
ncbi:MULTISPECIES: aldo/keto reductase [unclassified Halobacteriovorax]|uniref:aldo/keto reductase n=1 Tax=unclassified Halobacteriovorax TaxID=2639665 RepID=UPI00399A5891